MPYAGSRGRLFSLYPRLIFVLVLVATEFASGHAEIVLEEIDASEFLEPSLSQLCDEIGPRLPGTAGMSVAVDWAVEQLQDAGVDTVGLEPFPGPQSWREGRTRVEALSPVPFDIVAVATGWSPPTSPRVLRALLLAAGNGSEGDITGLGVRAAGKILLVELAEANSFYGLGVEQRQAIIAMREAGRVNAAGVLFASTRPNRLLYRHVHTVTGSLDPVPSAVATREDALRLSRLLEAGHEVELLMSLTNKVGPEITGQNVVAEIQGTDLAEEIVILGAHLDSWDLGSGCLDNGVNVVLTIEAARAIAASGSRPRRTIRFVLFGAEEQGLFGSRGYVRTHREELDNVTAVVVHDMGVGRVEGYALHGRHELEKGLRAAMKPISRSGATRHTTDAFFGSDHFDFLLEGVPVLVAIQDTGDYYQTYHSAADTLDKLDVSDVRKATRIAAATVYGLANLPERLGKRFSRKEISRQLDSTGMDEQLKFLGLWEQWESGERGREIPTN